MSRPSRDFRSASRDNYNNFCLKHPELNIDYATFKKIIYTWNGMFVKQILETGNRIKIPYGLGPITISKYKQRRSRLTASGKEMSSNIINGINWIETKKEGKYIYYLNHHTDGFRYFFYWSPYESYIKIPSIWKLEMARDHSRTLAAYLNKPNDYHKDLYKQWKLTR